MYRCAPARHCKPRSRVLRSAYEECVALYDEQNNPPPVPPRPLSRAGSDKSSCRAHRSPGEWKAFCRRDAPQETSHNRQSCQPPVQVLHRSLACRRSRMAACNREPPCHSGTRRRRGPSRASSQRRSSARRRIVAVSRRQQAEAPACDPWADRPLRRQAQSLRLCTGRTGRSRTRGCRLPRQSPRCSMLTPACPCLSSGNFVCETNRQSCERDFVICPILVGRGYSRQIT